MLSRDICRSQRSACSEAAAEKVTIVAILGGPYFGHYWHFSYSLANIVTVSSLPVNNYVIKFRIPIMSQRLTFPIDFVLAKIHSRYLLICTT